MPQKKAQERKTDLSLEELDEEMLAKWLEPINNSRIEKDH